MPSAHQEYVAYAAIAIICVLFVALFLQSAYARHTLQKLQLDPSSHLGMDGAQQDSYDYNSVRSYTVNVACCKTGDLNASMRFPPMPDSAVNSCSDPDSKDGINATRKPLARYLVLHRTSAAIQLRLDIVQGRVRYLLGVGSVLRVSSPELRNMFGEAQADVLNQSFIVLVLSDPMARGSCIRKPGARLFVPFSTREQMSDLSVGNILAACKASGSTSCTDKDDVTLHLWAYGTSPVAVSSNETA